MGIATSVRHYLDGRGVPYRFVRHTRAVTSSEIADASDIAGDNLAKGVLLKRKDGFILAIIPASCHVRLESVGSWLEQPVGLATEEEVASVFDDCELGCAPPLAGAYGLQGVMDNRLEGLNDIYFEAGDHCTLVHVKGRDFGKIQAGVPHAEIAQPDR
jgi:Ala-tRNA(Pro) deacylase